MGVCAYALILDDEGRLLLCRRRKDRLWNLPGGALDADEAPWQAVLREVEEELGAAAVVRRLQAVYWVPKKNDVVLTFVCALAAGTMQPAEEVEETAWFRKADLPSDMRPRHAERALDAFATATDPKLATQE